MSNAQLDFLSGTWQGIAVNSGKSNKDGNALWIKFDIDTATKQVTVVSKLETPFSKNYAIKSGNGKVLNRNEIKFNETFLGAQKNTGSNYWCLLKGTLKYNDSTGYLEGYYSSSDCRSRSGKIILFRSEHEMNKSSEVTLYHSWFNNFVNDLARGWNAYYVRDAELKGFVFKPVYFDHDKDILKPEFYSFLKQMVNIVQSHSDLRIKIIGHTDSNGSDEYNIGLSKRRADVIQAYLVSLGIKSDKIVIEFRGEKDPAVSNTTSSGKKLNRRVDFEFI